MQNDQPWRQHRPSSRPIGARPYRTLGSTGLKVSAIGFGGSTIGVPDYVSDEDRDSAAFQARARAAIQAALDQGINYFDTAPSYGDGRSERRYGEVLESHREWVCIATKIELREGATPAHYDEALGQSLERLRTDHVDVLQVHGMAWSESRADALLDSCLPDWLAQTRASGRCRHIGISAENTSGALERLLRTGRFQVLQIAYSLIYQSPCDHQREPFGVIPLARSLGMGVVTMRSATTGFLQKLLGAEFPELDRDRLTRLAIRFVVSTPEVDCALVGFKSPEEVRQTWPLARDGEHYLDVDALHYRFAR